MPSKSSPKPNSCGCCSLRNLSILAVVLALFSALYKYLDARLDQFYIFTPEQLHELSTRAIDTHGNNTRGMVDHIVGELDQVTPGNHVNIDQEWVFNNAGGAMGAMYIIHASKPPFLPHAVVAVAIAAVGITEYLIVFGTAIGTEGHTGRHTADDYFNILSGTQLAFVPGEFEPEVYPAGSVHHLQRGLVKQYKMESSCFALEYARGWIPPMLFFGYADTFSSTLDFPTLWATTRITGREMISNLLRMKL
ncbi:C-8 sterol isomerase [Aspergillus sp. HF37]|nr:C-8 sterol isomerase [Aspergillus sp. HF37]